MASFKKVQEMFCLCLIEEVIDEEEFGQLSEVNSVISLCNTTKLIENTL